MSGNAPPDDGVLLHKYAGTGDQGAFAALVARYAHLVYSAAMRQLHNADAAEEVTQAVFIVLAQKAKSIAPERVLGGWLLKAVRYAVADWNKRERRRRRHEHQAARMAQAESDPMRQAGETSDEWDAIAPVLDDAIDQLNAKLRDVVLLRFFHGKTHQQIAELLGISEWAARQRLSRSVEQMRRYFLQRGISVPCVSIAAMLPLHAVVPAPQTVIASSTAGALAAVAAGPSAAIAKGVLIMMAISKLKVLAVSVLLLLLLVGAAVVVTNANRHVALAPVAVPLDISGNVTGVVRDPSGKPLANAEVFVQDAQEPTYIDHTPPFLHPTRKTTGQDGGFSAPKPGGDFYLAVRHDAGVAWVRGSNARSTYDIVLRPWGRVEGTFRVGATTKAGVPVHIDLIRESDADPMIVLYDSTANTAEDGSFVFPRVPAGHALLARMIDGSAGEYTQVTNIIVLPGPKTVVSIGGNGSAVTGTAVLHSGPAQSASGPGLRATISLRTLSGDNAGALFYGTIDPNGRFCVDDVPPSNYLLTLAYSRPKPGGSLSDRVNVAGAHKQLTVPVATKDAVNAGILEAVPQSGPPM